MTIRNDNQNISPNLIGGEWTNGSQSFASINPSNTNDTVGHFAAASVDDVEKAVHCAAKAFDSWSRTGIQERSNILERAAAEILARKDELGFLLAREEGKSLPEAIGEATRAGQIFRFFAAEVLRSRGELTQSVRPGIEVEITREAVGVVGVITPWNFPLAIPAWKIAPALAYGNCVVFKPAELVPACAWALVDILHRAGLPAGVLNLLMGRGATVGEAITRSPLINAISFTGSTTVGQKVLHQAIARSAKVQLEMGGKNPLIVLDDADIAVAVNCMVQGAYFSTGQRCTASSRIIVTEKIHDAYIDALRARMRSLRVGDATATGTDIGPVVDEVQLQKDLRYIALAQREGGEMVHGGHVLEGAQPGHYLEPALFVGTTPEMTINREEVFGPLASVIRVKDYDEALAIANDTPFGLCGGIVTQSLKHATHYKRNAAVGMVMVNLPTAGVDYHVPFGGRKASSYGPREQGEYAREFYTTVKTAYISA